MATLPKLTDVLIIRGGPAGLSAALALSRVQRTVTVLDSGVYRNAWAEQMHNIAALEGTPPVVLRAPARKQLKAYGTATVVQHKTERFQASKLLLATGVEDILPEVSGYAELWGRKILHCAFCHGTEFAGKRGAIFTSASLLRSLIFLNVTKHLVLLLHGTPPSDSEAAHGCQHAGGRVEPSRSPGSSPHLLAGYSSISTRTAPPHRSSSTSSRMRLLGAFTALTSPNSSDSSFCLAERFR